MGGMAPSPAPNTVLVVEEGWERRKEEDSPASTSSCKSRLSSPLKQLEQDEGREREAVEVDCGRILVCGIFAYLCAIVEDLH